MDGDGRRRGSKNNHALRAVNPSVNYIDIDGPDELKIAYKGVTINTDTFRDDKVQALVLLNSMLKTVCLHLIAIC